MLDLSIILVNYNTKKITLDCLESIFSEKGQVKFDVWMVDNASADGSVEAVAKKFPQVKIIANKDNVGFARGNNTALKTAYKKARYCLLLNTDTIVMPGTLDGLIEFADKSEFGIVSCSLLNPDRTFQPNAGELPKFLPVFFWLSGLDDIFGKVLRLPSYHENRKKYYKDGREVGWVSGSVMLIKSDVFKKIGLLDSKIFMYAEDTDFCLRAKKAGFKVGWTDKVKIVHIGGASSDKPKFNQWKGEFSGLFYVYKKHFGTLASLGLRLISYVFIGLRAIAFLVVGKPEHAKTYAKVITSI